MKKLCLLVLPFVFAFSSHAQGTFVYDQQSSTDETYSSGGVSLQFYGFVGQSFTPSLSAVGFIRVRLLDFAPGNGIGTTLVLNLRSNAINGPILGTSTLVLGNGFSGSTNFIFASAIQVIPNLTYFFETSVQSGDDWEIRVRSDSLGHVNYPGALMFGGATPASGNDLWFREGIVIVPEPASVSLALLGGGLVAWFVRRKR